MELLYNRQFFDQKPAVSVCLITYNQSNFIEEALNSILIQETTFAFEIIIADDHSTDGTWERLLFFLKKNPERVLLIRQEKNVGLYNNWKTVIERARAPFVAYLEGDDYWTDTQKLVKQFEFLNNYPQHVLCYHPFILIDKNGNSLPHQTFRAPFKKYRTKEELAAGCQIHQNTMMFRKVFSQTPALFSSAKNLDTIFMAWLSNWGTAGYIEDIKPLMYRMHPNGVWSSQSRAVQDLQLLKTLVQISLVVPKEVQGLLKYKLFTKTVRIFLITISTNLKGNLLVLFISAIQYFPSALNYKFKVLFCRPGY